MSVLLAQAVSHAKYLNWHSVFWSEVSKGTFHDNKPLFVLILFLAIALDLTNA